jgi:hypothetical protein
MPMGTMHACGTLWHRRNSDIVASLMKFFILRIFILSLQQLNNKRIKIYKIDSAFLTN